MTYCLGNTYWCRPDITYWLTDTYCKHIWSVNAYCYRGALAYCFANIYCYRSTMSYWSIDTYWLLPLSDYILFGQYVLLSTRHDVLVDQHTLLRLSEGIFSRHIGICPRCIDTSMYTTFKPWWRIGHRQTKHHIILSCSCSWLASTHSQLTAIPL